MTIGSENVGDPRHAVLLRGRMALEALKSREQAALFHAAHSDLQVALLEAESGNDQFLTQWLQKYRLLMEQEPELQRHLSSVQSTFDFEAGSAETEKFVERDDPISPWPAMIAGANHRARVRISNDSNLPTELVEQTGEDVQKEGEAHKHLETMPLVPSPSPRGQGEEEEFSGSPELSGSLVFPKTIEPGNNAPIIPTSLRETFRQEKKATSKKKWAWLSSSVVGSIAAHFLALIVMSTFMVHLVRNTESKAIIASAVETETISMEAPVEMSSSDAPTLDPSESQMPTLPSFADVAAASSSDIQLPTSMTGLITGDTSSSTGDASRQATNSSMSNAAANSVQFFGVKAAGNTFCYVVDVSPSMKKDNAFAAAKAELVRSLSLLKPKQRFYISFFGGEIERLKLGGRDEERYPVYATPENLQKSLAWIDRVRVQEKGLPPNNALNEAIKMDPDGIFLLFDGDTTVDVAAYLRKANRSDDIISGGAPLVPIHTIGFFTQEFEALMKRIAVENSGVYRFVPKPTKTR